MAYKFFIIIVLVILAVLFLSSIIVYTPSREGEPARLGFVWERTTPHCTGELTITSSPMNEKCALSANIILKNCEGKNWSVFSGKSCSDALICDGNVEVSFSNPKCEWEDDKGTHTYTLCVDETIKARYDLIC